MIKKALITGISGQNGFYPAQFLLENHGINGLENAYDDFLKRAAIALLRH